MTDELDDNELYEYLENCYDTVPVVYSMGYKINPAAFMGEKEDDTLAVEEIVELATVGQLIAPDGKIVLDEDGRPAVALARIAIPKKNIEMVLKFLEEAYKTSVGDVNG